MPIQLCSTNGIMIVLESWKKRFPWWLPQQRSASNSWGEPERVGEVLNPLNPIVHFWLHHTAHCAEKVVSACYARWFCVSRKGGTAGGGWDQPQGDMHMVTARLGCQSAIVGTW